MLQNLFAWIRKSTTQAIIQGVNDAVETLEETELNLPITLQQKLLQGNEPDDDEDEDDDFQDAEIVEKKKKKKKK